MRRVLIKGRLKESEEGLKVKLGRSECIRPVGVKGKTLGWGSVMERMFGFTLCFIGKLKHPHIMMPPPPCSGWYAVYNTELFFPHLSSGGLSCSELWMLASFLISLMRFLLTWEKLLPKSEQKCVQTVGLCSWNFVILIISVTVHPSLYRPPNSTSLWSGKHTLQTGNATKYV